MLYPDFPISLFFIILKKNTLIATNLPVIFQPRFPFIQYSFRNIRAFFIYHDTYLSMQGWYTKEGWLVVADERSKSPIVTHPRPLSRFD